MKSNVKEAREKKNKNWIKIIKWTFCHEKWKTEKNNEDEAEAEEKYHAQIYSSTSFGLKKKTETIK